MSLVSTWSVFAAGSLNLAWDPSPASNLSGYIVRYATTSGQYTMSTNVGNRTNAMVGGLQNGTTYYFVVTAVNTSGMESDPSNEVGYTIPSANAPTISAIASRTIAEDSSTTAAFTIASATTPSSSLTLTASSSNTNLVPVSGIVFGGSGSNRTATVTPSLNRSGTATITITVNDGALTASSAFMLTVSAVNDVPTIGAIANRTVSEDAGVQTVPLAGIGSGATDEAQTLNLTATSSNPSLIPNPTVSYTSPGATGSLTFAPTANASGTATITVTVNDGQTLNNLAMRTFSVTVNAVNDPPTLNALSGLNISENSGAQTVNLSGISSGAANEVQVLTVSAVSSNPGLIPNPAVSYASPGATGTLAFTPMANATGGATITVTVNDGQALNSTMSRSFNVTVGTPPTSIIYVEAEAGVITSPMVVATDSNAANGQYVSTQTDNQGTASLQVNIPQAGDYVVWCRVLSVNAGTDSFFVSVDSGTEEIYATAQNIWSPNWQWTKVNGDNGASGSSRTFTLNQGLHTFAFRGRERGTMLDALYITNDPNFIPATGSTNTSPTLNAISNLVINEDSGQQTVSLTGISSGATGESQTLTVAATSSNPSLIPNPSVSYTSPNPAGTLTYAPVANANGMATITVTVDDGQALNNLATRTFTVTVNAVNDVPTISNLADQTISQGANTGPLSFTVGDVETPAGSLVLSGASSNSSLVPNSNIVFGGSGNSRTVTVTPAVGQSGTATITVTVTDAAGGSSSDTFALTVTAPNPPPTIVLTSPTSGASFTAPATIGLAASVTANGNLITKVQFFNGSTLLGEDASAPYSFAWNSVNAGNYTAIARVVYGTGSTVVSPAVNIVVAGLPAPWQTVDIGSVGIAGSAGELGGVYTVSGAGNISGTADNYRFVYQTLSGDGEIKFRINSVSNTGTSGRIGLMIRESLTSGSRYAFMGISPDGTFRWQRRSSTAGSTSSTTSTVGVFPNTWARLVRTGNTLSGYRSADGVNWTKVNSRNISMAASIYVGLAVASGSSTTLNASSFSSTTVVP